MAKKQVERWSCAQVIEALESMGNPQTVKTYRNHGAHGDLFGVKIGDMKKIIPHIRGDQAIAMELWDTNNSDAMYLAALVADGAQMSHRQLDRWARTAWWYMLSEYAVPSVAAEHADAFAIAMKWMGQKREPTVASGWCTYGSTISHRPDDQIDLDQVRQLLDQAANEIHQAPNRIRHCMNRFVISVGTFVKPLLKQAKAAAKAIGTVSVDMGSTSCKEPLATEYIAKVESMGRVGKKRASVKC